MAAPNLEWMKSFLGQLVSANTENPPGCEIEAAELLRKELDKFNFDTSLTEFSPGRANIVASLENGPGPTFAFNSHIDVVPAGQGWSTDPFILVEKEGRLYGRGSCDAKGPIVAMLEALRLLECNRQAWSGTLLGIFVADEEVASLGAKEFVKSQPVIDYIVVGEPTSNMTVTAHKGSIRAIVRVFGETAHSASPDLGENAIYRAAKLVNLIEAGHARLRERCHDLVGSPTLTVTRFNAGHADNVIPDVCELLIERRMIPGEDLDRVKKEFQETLDCAQRENGVRAEIVGYKPIMAPAETPADHPIVKTCLGVGHNHGCKNDNPAGFQGGCDLVYFRSIGAQGVVLGPGAISVAHKPDEFVPIEEFANASLIYYELALAMLSGRAVS